MSSHAVFFNEVYLSFVSLSYAAAFLCRLCCARSEKEVGIHSLWTWWKRKRKRQDSEEKGQPDCRFSFHALIPKGALDVRSDCGGYGMGFRWAQAWLGSGLEMGSESPSGHCNKLEHQLQFMLTEKQAVIQFDFHQERAHR